MNKTTTYINTLIILYIASNQIIGKVTKIIAIRYIRGLTYIAIHKVINRFCGQIIILFINGVLEILM